MGESRPWSCWAASIAQNSIFPPVPADDRCKASGSIHLAPPTARRLRPLALPGPPTSLAAAVSGPTVVLTWTAPVGGDPPTSYAMEAGSASGLSDLANSNTGSSTPAMTATNVPAGTYYVRVRARNASGTSAASNEVLVIVTGACPTAPSPPTSLVAAVTGSAVTLTWQAATGGCAPTTYRIEAGSGSGLSDLASFSTGSAEATYAASGVASGLYYVRVRAVNAAGTSAVSNEVSVIIGGCTGAPAAPGGLVGQISGSSILLSWTASSGSPASYILEAGTSSGSSNIVTSDTGSLSTSLTASAGAGTYYIRVRARNACGTGAASNEVIVVVPASTSCVSITPTNLTVGDTAIIGSVTVTAASSCTWTAVSSASFVTITAGSSGTGSGSVSYNIAANTTGSARTATLTIGGQTFTITQQACSYTTSIPALFAAEGAAATVTVTTASGCAWTAQSDASFATITSAASGTGPGAFGINVAANSGTVRGATLTIGQSGVTATAKIVQSGPSGSVSCVTSMLHCISTGCESATFTAAAGTKEIILSAPNTCPWIAAPSVSWVTAHAAPNAANTPYGIGAGRFGFSVTVNTSETARSGSIVAGGHTFPITQAACAYVVSPPSVSVLASGGTGIIGVQTTCAAAWTAVSNASFITVTSGSGATGDANVTVTIAANSGSARTGTVTVAGQTVTVTQSAP